MFYYYTTKSWAALVAGLIVSVLILQTVTPTITYATEEPAEETSVETVMETPTEEPATEEEETITPPPPPVETTVETGDAVAGSDIENQVNSSDTDTEENKEETDTEEDPSDETPEDPESETTVLEEVFETIPEIPTDPDLLTIEATNTATTTNNATTTATTGSNTAGGEIVTINTGDAVAYTDVLNVVNTNIVDSAGLIKFVNETLGYQDFDLRDEFELTYTEFETAETTPSCNLDSCNNGTDIIVNTSNVAVIENNITVVADTGYNQADGDKSTINTGDAYASANVINVANTNITDSNYLLLVFNNFNSYAGDIILPNSSFFDNFLQTTSGVNNTELTTDNSANIDNSVTVVADSGGNEATGDNSNITTGNTGANSNITNTVNRNIVGGSSFSMLIRVHGDWSGNITGLPEGLTWRQTDQGIEIVSLDGANTSSPTQNLVQSTKNSATINNNVKVFALTGDNEASGDEVDINTGNAYADSSILNIANTNVIGSNWSNLIFTIYGNWSGNLSFGQPNLWLGVTANSSDSPIMPGSKVTYTYTVFNNGDVTAPNVNLASVAEGNVLVFSNPDSQTAINSNTQNNWSLGDIGAGETREVSYTATIDNTINGDVVSAIPLTGRVTSDQNDADDSDNEEVIIIYVGEINEHSSSRRSTFAAKFDIEKTGSQNLAQPGDVVDYTVSFFNRGGPLFDALLVDTLENEAGEIVQQQSWPLEEIKNWETINVSYSIEFNGDMATGTYTNYAQLIGFHESKKEKYQTPYESPIASHTLILGDEPVGQVLGIQTTSCPAYLTEYLRYGIYNSVKEVTKLQVFLNNHLSRNLNTSGVFGPSTEQAVRDFQQLYQSEILTPWGLTRDSGYVYYTTQKKINELACEGQTSFPLAPEQEEEIVIFKSETRNTPRFSSLNEEESHQVVTVETPPIAIISRPILEDDPEKTTLPNITTNLIPLENTIRLTGIRNWWQSFFKTPKIALR